MTEDAQSNWMTVTDNIRSEIHAAGWLNIGFDERDDYIRRLKADLVAAKELLPTLSLAGQRKMVLEIAHAEEGLKGLTAAFKPPNR